MSLAVNGALETHGIHPHDFYCRDTSHVSPNSTTQKSHWLLTNGFLYVFQVMINLSMISGSYSLMYDVNVAALYP